MLINVVPTAACVNLSAVVFSVVFEDLDPGISTPLSWVNQLRNLRCDELDIPQAIHALDKAVGIVCLLDEVTFDLSTNLVSCQFLDGSMEQWPLDGARCVESLERIVFEVNQSSLVDREREKEREKEMERKRIESSSTHPSGKATRHKKQRSLLMTLVASIIPLYSPTSHSRLPSPPPTPIAERKFQVGLPISPRQSRRRARSDLVDTFRRYALTELSRRFPRGGYYSWILQSMLHRTLIDMEGIERLAHSSGPPDADSVIDYVPHGHGYFSITSSSLPPTPSASEDGHESLDTDTDGSSLHTPTSSRTNIFQQPAQPPNPSRIHISDTPYRSLSDKDQATYTRHVEHENQLRYLLHLDDTRQEQESEDIKHHYHVLEVRSRRRAWLNKALVGGVRGGNDVGMAMPFRSSPLALRSWSSEDCDYESVLAWPTSPQDKYEYDEYDKVELGMKRPRRGTITPLFPVSEESEDYDDLIEDEALDARELELQLDGFEIDLEGGVRCNDNDMESGAGLRVAFEMERPQLRPRIRTTSMLNSRLYVPFCDELKPTPTPTPQQQRLTSSSLLCQPLSIPGNPPDVDAADLGQPPIYTEVDVNLNVGQLDVVGMGGFEKHTEDEFTLSMDLPLSVRVQDCGSYPNRRRVNVDADRGWPCPRIPRPPPNFCS